MKFNIFLKYTSFIMVLLYWIVGIYILTLPSVSSFSITQKNLLGLLLISYGIYRSIRIYKMYIKKNENS